jgi:hypothetical protein
MIKILASRRAYEFRVDDLRLTAFCSSPVSQRIHQHFTFNNVAWAAPPPVFGPVPETYPPGAVFQFGQVMTPSGLVPIRFINIEATRIVIDLAGPSSYIASVYEQLIELCAAVPLASGDPIIGTPTRQLEQSELVAEGGQITGWLNPRLTSVLQHYVDPAHFLVPSVRVAPTETIDLEYQADLLHHPRFVLEPRGGIAPREGVLFSSAPLDSERHSLYLGEVIAALRDDAVAV